MTSGVGMTQYSYKTEATKNVLYEEDDYRKEMLNFILVQ